MAKVEVLLLLAAASLVLAATCRADLSVGYYDKECPSAESIIKKILLQTLKTDPGIGAAILRLHFHDCFVEGCDGSVLVDSKPGYPAEKSSPTNVALRAFDVVDTIKAALEKACPGVVSCADILAFGARDGVVMMGGPSWEVPAGRKDGKLSSAARATASLPLANNTVDQLIANFASKGLDVKDLVVLSGAHTVGVGHCAAYSSRLYSFGGVRGAADPSLNASLAAVLKQICPFGTTNTSIFAPMDSTPLTFDTQYYRDLEQGNGLFTSDAVLVSSHKTSEILEAVSVSNQTFFEYFVDSMLKMSKIGVKCGYQGEVRANCSIISGPT